MAQPKRSRDLGYPEVLPIQQTMRSAVFATGLSAIEIADRSGLSRSAVSEMLSGRVRGTLTSWQRILTALNIKLECKSA